MADDALVTAPWGPDRLDERSAELRASHAATGASAKTRELTRQYVAAAVGDVGEAATATPADRAYLAGVLNDNLGMAPADAVIAGDISEQLDLFAAGRAIASTEPSQASGHRSPGAVDLFTGQFCHEAADLVIRGGGIDFAFTRTYKSQAAYAGPLGARWFHPYDLWLREVGTTVVRFSGTGLEEGYLRHPRFGQASYDYWVPPDGELGIVVAEGASYVWRGVGGRRVVYEADPERPGLHRARRVEDRFGNALALDYDGTHLTGLAVNRPDRRVTLVYDDQDRIVDVIDYTGRRCTYTYDDYGDLAAVTRPATARYPAGLTTCYEYTSPGAPPSLAHRLVRLVDPDGTVAIENDYGDAAGTLPFGRVVRQRRGGGEALIDYEAVLNEFDADYGDTERPALQVNYVGRNGHLIHYVHNRFGNLLLREEYTFDEGIPRLLQVRYRYNRDGRLIASLSAEGSLAQRLYGRDDFVRRNGLAAGDDVREHDALTAEQRLTFGNLLATVQRAERRTVATLDLSRGIWGDIYPDVLVADPEDVVRRFTYEPDFQQPLTASDPRFTQSPDPRSPEPLRHLTRNDYSGPPLSPNLLLARVTSPATTQPGGTVVPGLVQEYPLYDGGGRCLEDVDAAGTVTRRTYFQAADGVREGYLRASELDPGGLAIRVEREVDARGVTTAIRHARATGMTGGHFVTWLESNELDQLERVELSAPFGYVSRRFFDRRGLLERKEADLLDEHGQPTHGGVSVERFEHDSEGNITVEATGGIDPGSAVALRHDYDAAGQLVLTTTAEGRRTGRTYDGRMLEATATRGWGTPAASTRRTQYDGDGRLIRVWSGRGSVTHYRYDPLGRLRVVEDALGTLTRLDYDKVSNPVLIRVFQPRPGGFELLSRIERAYDELGRLIAETRNLFPDPLPVADTETAERLAPGPGVRLTTAYFYDASGRLERILDPLGRQLRLIYDAAGREQARIDALGNRVELTLDPQGNCVRRVRLDRVLDPVTGTLVRTEVFTETYDYDELDRLVSRTDSLGSTTAYAYDSLDRLVGVTDPLGNVLRFVYDLYGRRVEDRRERTATGLGGGAPVPAVVTGFGHDREGLLIRVTDPEQRVTRHNRDALGRRVAVVYADGSTETWMYDRDDNVVELRDPDGVQRRFTVDALGRAVRVEVDRSAVPAGLEVEGETVEEYRYDGAGHVLEEANDFGWLQSRFDSLGRAWEETFTGLGALASLGTVSVQRRYDAMGALSELTYPGGRRLRYHRDALGRLLRLEQVARGIGYPGSSTFANLYDILEITYAGLRADRVVFANGASSAWAVDGAGRLIMTEHHLGGGPPILLEQQLHDAVGNVRLRNRLRPGAAGDGEHLRYDSSYRLTEIEPDPGMTAFAPGGLAPAAAPVVGPIPHRQAVIDALLGPLAQTAAPGFAYDRAANREIERAPSRPAVSYTANTLNQYTDVGGEGLAYDRSGNLRADGSRDYVYDARRLLVHVRDRATRSDLVEFFHDTRGRRIAERRGAALTQLILDGPNLLEERQGGNPVRQYVHEGGLDTTRQIAEAGSEHWLHRDAIGSTRLLTDDAGALVATFLEDPFGVPIGATGTTCPLRYCGRRYDRELQMYDFRAREYAPRLGRFLQRDPREGVGSDNLYQYARDNPLRLQDPLGLQPTEQRAATVGDESFAGFVTDFLIGAGKGYGRALADSWMPLFDITGIGRDLANRYIGAEWLPFGTFDVSTSPLSVARDPNRIPQSLAKGPNRLAAELVADTATATVEPLDRSAASLRAGDINGWIGGIGEFVGLLMSYLAGPAGAKGEAPGPPPPFFQLAPADAAALSAQVPRGLGAMAERTPGLVFMAKPGAGQPPSKPKLSPADQQELDRIRQRVDDLATWALGMADAEGIPRTFGRSGTWSHGVFEFFMNVLDDELKAGGKGFSSLAEQYFDPNGVPASRRAKFSLGIDVLILFNDDPVLGLDLKSGRGWTLKELHEYEARTGVDVEQIGPWVP